MSPQSYATADLSDIHEDARHLPPDFADFGGRDRFFGQVATLATFEDNTKLRAALETDGAGRVLVVDGGASMRCALLGGNLAALAAQNGWAGVVINGCVRDVAELAAADVGIKALAAHPKKSRKRDAGEMNVPLNIGGVAIAPDDWLYADEDGVLVADRALHDPA